MEDEKTTDSTGPPARLDNVEAAPVEEAKDPAGEIVIIPDVVDEMVKAITLTADSTATAQEAAEPEAATGPIPIVVDYGRVIDLGHVKDAQEDACLVEPIYYPDRDPRFAVITMIGADGIGGSGDAGEVFAQTAIHITWTGIRRLLPYSERFAEFLQLATHDACWKKLTDALRPPNGNAAKDPLMAQIFWANATIRDFARRLFVPEKQDMFERGGFGCTLVVGLVFCDLVQGRVNIQGYGIGDSKVFLVLDDSIEQISTDHVEIGEGGKEYLADWLGRSDRPGGNRFVERNLTVDQFSKGHVGACSDGLLNMIPLESIPVTCSQFASAQERASALRDRALNAETPHNPGHTPGDDNIFVTLTSFQKRS